MWKYHVITAYRAAHKNGELRFPARSAFLKQYPSFNGLLKKLYDLTWYAHIGACLLDPSASLRYIGRYTKRAVLAEYRITYYDGEKVRFAFKDYAEGGKTSFKTLPVLAFIGRLVRHIPDKHFKMVRYSGLFATRWKSRCSVCRQPMVLREVAFGPPCAHRETLPCRRLSTQVLASRMRDATMMGALRWLFSKVTYTCQHCGATQRIPLRRLHAFERFHRLDHGEALLILCPQCRQGLQMPSPYRSHTGHHVAVDPDNPPESAHIHHFY